MTLLDFGIPHPLEEFHRKTGGAIMEKIRQGGTTTMADKKDFKKASAPTIVKLEKKGDIASGKFISLEESKMYPSSYALKYMEGTELKLTFINALARDLFVENGVESGSEFILEHNGTAKSKAGMSYNTFNLYYK